MSYQPHVHRVRTFFTSKGITDSAKMYLIASTYCTEQKQTSHYFSAMCEVIEKDFTEFKKFFKDYIKLNP